MKKKESLIIDNIRQNVKRIQLCCQRIDNRRYKDTPKFFIPMIKAMGLLMQETIEDMLLNVDKYTEWVLKE